MQQAPTTFKAIEKLFSYMILNTASFINFKKNIQKLFELDAKLNLTSLDINIAKEFIDEKLSKKYELYIVTAYVFRDDETKSAGLLKNKFNYLIKEFPFIRPQQYIFTSNKEIINCEIKIDDKESNLSGNAETKLLFTSYHNKNITDEDLKKNNIIRVNNWKDIEKILL